MVRFALNDRSPLALIVLLADQTGWAPRGWHFTPGKAVAIEHCETWTVTTWPDLSDH